VALKSKTDAVNPETYILVYEPCVHPEIVVLRSSSFTEPTSNPGVVATSEAVLNEYVPAVSPHPLFRYVPILSCNSS
jgi:hypothetical protein